MLRTPAGKRVRVDDIRVPSFPPLVIRAPQIHKSQVNAVLDERRLFHSVLVDGQLLRGLFDPGSCCTYVGKPTFEKFSNLLERLADQTRPGIMYPNGVVEEIAGQAILPIKFLGLEKTLQVRFAPTFDCEVLLGHDFAELYDFDVRFKHRIWRLGEGNWYSYQGQEIGPTPTRAESSQSVGESSPRGNRANKAPSNRACAGLTELHESEARYLEDFLSKKIPPMPTRLPATNLTKHTIDVQGHQPIKQCHRRLSPKVEEAFREAAQKLEDEGIIGPSGSEWCNPVVMVRKSDGGHRLCIDFRKLNEVAKKDAYPMKNISEILDKLSSAKYISKIDLSEAFHQIPLAEESKELTAFPVPGKGLFHHNRMPFGLSGAPARFQRLLDRLITPEFEPHAFAYLDDIIVVSETFKEHTYWLERVLDAILKAGLTVNREKSEFGCSQVRYLGYLVDRTGMHPDPEKVEPIISYPAPNTLRKLRRFLGMVSWYRKFLKDFAAKAEPLYRLLKKNRRYTWENEQEQAF